MNLDHHKVRPQAWAWSLLSASHCWCEASLWAGGVGGGGGKRRGSGVIGGTETGSFPAQPQQASNQMS